MSNDNKSKTDCKALSVDQGPSCDYDTDDLVNSRQLSFQHLKTFPLPKNWSNIERLKNQRNEIQEKLLQQSFQAKLSSKKEVISRKDNVICNDKVSHKNPFGNYYKHIASSDEDCSSDSEGHLVIDDEFKHSDTQLDQPVIQTSIHIHRSKSEDDATKSCIFKMKRGKRSKSTSDCTSACEDKDLCELKVANINDSFFMAISGTEIVTNTLEDGKPVVPTIYPHARPCNFPIGSKWKCAELVDKDSIAVKRSKDSKDTLDSEESNKSPKKDQPDVKQMMQTRTDSLKLVVPNPSKRQCGNTKKKIKPYLLANNKKARKKLLNDKERKTFMNVTKPNKSRINEKDDVLRHPSPEFIILENESKSLTKKRSNNLSDQSTVSNSRKLKSINNECITTEDKSFTSGEQLLEKELIHDIIVHQDCKNKNGNQQKADSKELQKSLNYRLSGKNAIKIKNPEYNSQCTFTNETSLNAIAVGRGRESDANDIKKNSTSVQDDTQIDDIQHKIPLPSMIPTTSQCLNIVTTCSKPIKAEIMKGLIPVDKHINQQNTDYFKVKTINEDPLPDTLRKIDKPASAMLYTKQLQYSKSPSILIPVKPMAMQTTIGHPFAMSPMPSKTMSQPHVDQKLHHGELGKPVLLVVDKMNHVLPQSSSKFLILNPITSTRTLSKQITTMPNALSPRQIFLSSPSKTDQSDKGLEQSNEGVLQPMHNVPVLQVISSLATATTSESPLIASSVSSMPTHDINSSPCYKSSIEAVSLTPRKATSLEDNACKISGNKEQEMNEKEDKQTVSPKQSVQQICAHKDQTKKSKNKSKYIKNFKEIATWNKYDENDNIVIDTIGDAKFNKSFDNEQSMYSPKICSIQGWRNDFKMQYNEDKEHSPSSQSVCPSSQNSVLSIDSDSDQSYDSIDMDHYRKMKNDKNSKKQGGKNQSNDKNIAKYTNEQSNGTLNTSCERKFDINELPTADVQNTEFIDFCKKSLGQKSNSSLSFNYSSTECPKDSVTESLKDTVTEVIGEIDRQENTQLSKVSQEDEGQQNEDKKIKLKSRSKGLNKTLLTEVKGENIQTLKQTGNTYIQNLKEVNRGENHKVRPENGSRVKHDEDISEQRIKTVVRSENGLTAMQIDPVSLMQTDPVSLKQTEPVPSVEIDPLLPMQTDPLSEKQTDHVSPIHPDPMSPETSDKHTSDLSRARLNDVEQKRFLRTKFIILKVCLLKLESLQFEIEYIVEKCSGDICKKWLDVKKKAGFGNVPDPGFVHYLLDMVEKGQEGETKAQQTFEATQTSETRQDDQTSKRLSKKRHAENDRCQENNHQNKKPKIQSPSRRQRNTSNGHSFLSKSVQKQINWAVNVFREWLKSLGDTEIDFEYQSTAWLNLMLERFYKEARTIDNTLYTREDLQNLRRCLSVYLDGFPESNSVAISIQLDPGFYTSNQVLVDVVKTRQEVSPDENNCYILQEDFVKIYTSETLSDSDPVSLLWKVWFDMCFHLCNKHFPENFLKSLKKHHISLQSDINGVFYTFIDSDELSLPSEESCGRMYATPDSPNRCPVRSTTVYLSKLCNSTEAFFQCPNPNWRDSQLWYRPIPLTSVKLNSIMQKISAKAKLSRLYTTSDVFATWVKYKSLKTNDKETPTELD